MFDFLPVLSSAASLLGVGEFLAKSLGPAWPDRLDRVGQFAINQTLQTGTLRKLGPTQGPLPEGSRQWILLAEFLRSKAFSRSIIRTLVYGEPLGSLYLQSNYPPALETTVPFKLLIGFFPLALHDGVMHEFGSNIGKHFPLLIAQVRQDQQTLMEEIMKSTADKSEVNSKTWEYVRNFANDIKRLGEGFVGRDWVIESVASFIVTRKCGYFRVVGDPGLGKTALAANLASRLNAAACFFFGQMGGTKIAVAHRTISSQLIRRYELEDSFPFVPADIGEDAGFLLEVLEEASERSAGEEPIILVIDGVDEAELARPGLNCVNLPVHLPPGVFVVLTHRRFSYTLTCDSETSIDSLDIVFDERRHQEDVRNFIHQWAQRPSLRQLLDRSSSQFNADELEELLLERSEGNFMFLSYVFKDIEEGQIDLDSKALHSLPKGLAGYYDAFWAQMSFANIDKSWSEWSSLYQPVIGLITIAFEPVTDNWLSLLVERPLDEIHDVVLMKWRRFLRSYHDGDTEYWTPHHKSFADFVHDRLQESGFDLKVLHRKVADYYLRRPYRWREENNYALRNLTQHLCELDVRAELSEVLESVDWAMAQETYDPTLQNYHEDLRRGLLHSNLDILEDLPEVVAWTLISTTLQVRGLNVPSEVLKSLVALGDVDQALRYAEFQPRLASYAKARADIAGALAHNGQIGHADKILDGLRLDVREPNDSSGYSEALNLVICGLIELGKLDQARELTPNDYSPVVRLETRIMLATKLAAAGQNDRALELAERRSKFGQILGESVLEGVIVGMAEAGNLSNALSLTMNDLSSWRRAHTLIAVAEQLISAGSPKKAIEILDVALEVNQDNSGIKRAQQIGAISLAFASVNQGAKVRCLVDQGLSLLIEEGDESSFHEYLDIAEVYTVLASALGQFGDSDRAISITGLAVDAANRFQPLPEGFKEVVFELAKAGEFIAIRKAFAEAMWALAGEASSWDEDEQFKILAIAVGEIGWFDHAIGILERIRSHAMRSRTLAAISGILVAAGNEQSARKLLVQSISESSQGQFFKGRDKAFAEAVALCATDGLLDQCPELIAGIKEIRWRIRSLVKLGSCLAGAGRALEADSALDTAAILTQGLEYYEKDEAQENIASAMAETGNCEKAFILLERCDNEWTIRESLANIGSSFARADRPDIAMQFLGKAQEGIEINSRARPDGMTAERFDERWMKVKRRVFERVSFGLSLIQQPIPLASLMAKCKTHEERLSVYRGLFSAFLNSGPLEEDLLSAADVRKSSIRWAILSNPVTYDPRQALRALNAVIPSEWTGQWQLHDEFVIAMVSSGLFDEGLRVCDKARSPRRDHLFSVIAKRLAEDGKFEQANKVAEKIFKYDSLKAYTLVAIAISSAIAGDSLAPSVTISNNADLGSHERLDDLYAMARAHAESVQINRPALAQIVSRIINLVNQNTSKSGNESWSIVSKLSPVMAALGHSEKFAQHILAVDAVLAALSSGQISEC